MMGHRAIRFNRAGRNGACPGLPGLHNRYSVTVATRSTTYIRRSSAVVPAGARALAERLEADITYGTDE